MHKVNDFKVVHLCHVSGEIRMVYVHELVAIAHVPNPHQYDEIVFINHDTTDCSAENLRWSNKEEAENHPARGPKSGNI